MSIHHYLLRKLGTAAVYGVMALQGSELAVSAAAQVNEKLGMSLPPSARHVINRAAAQLTQIGGAASAPVAFKPPAPTPTRPTGPVGLRPVVSTKGSSGPTFG